MTYILYFIIGVLAFVYFIKFFFSSLGVITRLSWEGMKFIAKVIAVVLLIWIGLQILR